MLLAIPGAREADLVTALDGPRSSVRVMRRCADTTEMLAAALAGLGEIAVVDAAVAGVDRQFVRRLQQAGVHVVLLAPADDAERCRALGAEAVLEHAEGVDAWAHAVRHAAGELAAEGTGPRRSAASTSSRRDGR
ncbi:MAG TPA: hypothetical protein VK024_05415, partial [Actinomycetaceae bacterium]|nr:hypothetical protein [Actinomycetaceae bacterium]